MMSNVHGKTPAMVMRKAAAIKAAKAILKNASK